MAVNRSYGSPYGVSHKSSFVLKPDMFPTAAGGMSPALRALQDIAYFNVEKNYPKRHFFLTQRMSRGSPTPTRRNRGVFVYNIKDGSTSRKSEDDLPQLPLSGEQYRDIKRGQRFVDIDIKGDQSRNEADAHVASVRLPLDIMVRRYLGDYEKLYIERGENRG